MSNQYAQILHKISRKISSKQPNLKTNFLSDGHHANYAIKNQYSTKLKYGFPFDIENKAILEISCGHARIILFLAINGSTYTNRIDLAVKTTIYDAFSKLNILNEKLNKIRAYEDLNYITHRKFKQIAKEANFKIQSFWVSPPFSNYFVNNLMRPILNNKRVSTSRISDVLSKMQEHYSLSKCAE